MVKPAGIIVILGAEAYFSLRQHKQNKRPRIELPPFHVAVASKNEGYLCTCDTLERDTVAMANCMQLLTHCCSATKNCEDVDRMLTIMLINEFSNG